MLTCSCGFTSRWRDYRKSFRSRGLHGPRGAEFFEDFIRRLPNAETARAKS